MSRAKLARFAPQSIEVHGNRGGSFVSITRVSDKDETIHLRVGHRLVVRVDGVMKVTDLAKLLSKHAAEIHEILEDV